MVKSMTGYGRGEFSIGDESFTVEARSLNNRYLDARIKTPERFIPLDARIRKVLKERFSRGGFTVYVAQTSAEEPSLKLNLPLARAYSEAAGVLKKELGLGGEPDLRLLFGLRDIFYSEKKSPDLEGDWEEFKKGLAAALDQLEEWRTNEGAALEEDLSTRIDSLEGMVEKVQAMSEGLAEALQKRLTEKLSKLLSGEVDEARVVQEAALLAERADISEELVRLSSHIELFRDYMKRDEPVGKRLDFLCQEILREANTIASKSGGVETTQTVVEIKGALEKIREQVQNVE